MALNPNALPFFPYAWQQTLFQENNVFRTSLIHNSQSSLFSHHSIHEETFILDENAELANEFSRIRFHRGVIHYSSPPQIRFHRGDIHYSTSHLPFYNPFEDAGTIILDEDGELVDEFSTYGMEMSSSRDSQVEELVDQSMLRRRTYKKHSDEEGEICVVCQDDYADNEEIVCLPCGHDYHSDCIDKWLLYNSNCPICRASAFL